jgi:hypothetical protein
MFALCHLPRKSFFASANLGFPRRDPAQAEARTALPLFSAELDYYLCGRENALFPPQAWVSYIWQLPSFEAGFIPIFYSA